MATLDATGDHDYSVETLSDITDLVLNTSAGFSTITFNASQFDDVQVSKSLHITGDSNTQSFVILAASNFSAAAWTFTPNTGYMSLDIRGTAADDTITGSDILGGNLFVGGLGKDTLVGGTGPDNFRYNASAEIEAGETISGGGGSNVIQLNVNGSSYNFTGALISGVGSLLMNLGGANGSLTAKFTGAQLGASGINRIVDSVLFKDTVIVTGKSVDLSTTDFTNWTSGTDVLKIIGTTGNDVLKGSIQKDIITGGLGKDMLTGNGGPDVFDFNKLKDSVKGAAHDVIKDFVHLTDRIDLTGIDARVGPGNNAFKYIGTQAFHHKAGELHYVVHPTSVVVEGDVNGDGKADIQILLSGVHLLSKGDFLL